MSANDCHNIIYLYLCKQSETAATAFSTSKSYLVVGMIAQVIRLT